MGTQAGKSKKPKTIIREVVLSNPTGMHARPSSMFVKLASSFSCEVTVTKDGESVNGKSIMGLLTLAISCGSTVVIETVGTDAVAAADALQQLVASNFSEGRPAAGPHAN